MLFLCDAMLGRLAHWLRLLGYDADYSDAGDHDITRQARAEKRIVLTRDVQLAQRRGIKALLIASDDLEVQLRQVIQEFGLTRSKVFSRCPACNSPLREIPKPAAEDRVPPFVFQRHSSFHECPACAKVYWRGTHWQRIREQLDALDVDE